LITLNQTGEDKGSFLGLDFDASVHQVDLGLSNSDDVVGRYHKDGYSKQGLLNMLETDTLALK
jgi:hypothetical protein